MKSIRTPPFPKKFYNRLIGVKGKKNRKALRKGISSKPIQKHFNGLALYNPQSNEALGERMHKLHNGLEKTRIKRFLMKELVNRMKLAA